ncbi:hypothetical protein lerEdw1_003495 [Lerista edwardsae]|nr:hypothetical protein lerEdw1_003495 [Lerista edwardsae]
MAAGGGGEAAAAEEELRDMGGSEGELEEGEDDDGEESEGSSGDGEDEEKENEAEIQRLEEQLSINAFDYNCHLDLIKLLRQEGELVRLRRARQKMSELFPLTEEIWLDWLKDEIRMAAETSEREKIYDLFERAVKDYLCPEIWLEFAQYSIGGIGQAGGIEKVRSIFERALTAVGLHVIKGAAVWEACREFENAILETVQPAAGSVPTPEQQQTLGVQLEKIHVLFRRQLGIPLLDMEATYAEYEEWSEEAVPEAVTKSYKKALQQMKKYKPFEEALLGAEAPKLAEYQAYIEFETKGGDPARIQLIYERALAENCLVPDLWARYTQYLDRQLKVKELVLSAHERAVRNCPWTVKLWDQYLLAMERHRVAHQQVSETFEKALSAGFIQATDYVEIWQAYLNYLRRRVDFSQVQRMPSPGTGAWRTVLFPGCLTGCLSDSSKELEELRAAFAQAIEYLKQEVEERFSESGDPSCTIMQTWARVEARLCNNMQKARELWDSIMTKGNARYAHMWLEYYNLERAHGDTQHCRKALHRAVQCTSDYPEHVCEVLLTLERIEGSLEDWDTAVQKTENRLARVNEQRAKAAEKEALLVQQEGERAEQRKQARAEKRAAKKSKKLRPGEKRKADEESWGQEDEAEQPSKRPRASGSGDTLAEEQEQEEEEDMETETGLFGRGGPRGKAAPAWKEPPRVPHNSAKDGVTVFVSNLAYTLEEPGEKLRALFAGCGEVADVRPVFSHKGAFRGYCYVEFAGEEAALQALGLDRTRLEGRPMFVSPCVDKAKNPDFKVFKYGTALEKHKLFISGLPFSCTREELREVCGAHGSVKDIRLVTTRAGKPKGLAYVEYESEEQAAQAVLKMDGLTLGGCVLKVAISNPPARRLPESVFPRRVPGARSKGRTQLAMIPRALNRQSNPPAMPENGVSQAPPAAAAAAPSPSTGESTRMSNADFARLLLNK